MALTTRLDLSMPPTRAGWPSAAHTTPAATNLTSSGTTRRNVATNDAPWSGPLGVRERHVRRAGSEQEGLVCVALSAKIVGRSQW